MNRILATFFSFYFLIISFKGNSQILYAEIGVDGLTCSQCQRSVEMSVRKLNFVDSVRTDLANTDGYITFKKGEKVDVAKIAKAITDAGFSVRFIKLAFKFNNLNVINNYCYTFEGNNYQLVNFSEKNLSGEILLRVVGKKFMPSSEYKKIKSSLKLACKEGNTFFVTQP